MSGRDLEVDVFVFLQSIQLEQFYHKINDELHLTRLSHFDHVTESDLEDINMSKPEQRRLFDAVKKYKKEKKKGRKIRISFRRKKKDGSPQSSNEKLTEGNSCLISQTSLKFTGKLGDGAFGVVSKGEWAPKKGSKIPVAVKYLKFSNKDVFLREQDNLMREASAMSDFNHPNVIRLYGIVLATPIMLVLELAPLGSLLYRLKREPKKFLISTLFDFVLQIVSGMSYLESKRFVHRDLALRNILLYSYDKIKIGDFGLMRILPSEDDVYVMKSSGKIAVAWCAPECLKNREFSHASDVWALGITVIEMFSYGRQPWEGLSGSQILEIIDEPANGRPGKPDHCPDRLYSLLIEHCWDPNPKDRGKFISIQERLYEVTPEDVTCCFELQDKKNTELLLAKSGDLITVVSWKSRLGTEFAKGQNKRTSQVGYFPTSLVTRTLKRKGSMSKTTRAAKVKDISPPLDNSFSHCAHRGDGDTPDWGSVMSDERQVIQKQLPLNLPTKLIPLNSSSNNQTGESTEPFDVMNPDISDSSSSSLVPRSCADSGYYSNRDTLMSQDYELMNGSKPISIPGSSAQGRQISPGINYKGNLLSIQQCFPFPLGMNTQLDQQSHRDSMNSEISFGSDSRPVLPMKRTGYYSNLTSKENYRKSAHPYENISEIPETYENIDRSSLLVSSESQGVTEEVYVVPQVSDATSNVSYDDNIIESSNLYTSSTENIYVNDVRSNERSSVPVVNVDYSIYDTPTITSQYLHVPTNGRCHSFPEFDLRHKLTNGISNRNSLSMEKEMTLHVLYDKVKVKSAPTLDRKRVCYSKNYQSDEDDPHDEIYENIEIYDVPQNIKADVPPPLPFKRHDSVKRFSFHSNRSSYDFDISRKQSSSEELLEDYYSRPVSQNLTADFDSHLYAEISDKLIKHLRLQNEDTISLNSDSFTGISKDYAALDKIYDKLHESVVDNEETDANVLWKRSYSQEKTINNRRSKRNSASSLDYQSSSRSVNRRPSLPSRRSSLASQRSSFASKRSSLASQRSSSINSLKVVGNEGMLPVNTSTALVTTV